MEKKLRDCNKWIVAYDYTGPWTKRYCTVLLYDPITTEKHFTVNLYSNEWYNEAVLITDTQILSSENHLRQQTAGKCWNKLGSQEYQDYPWGIGGNKRLFDVAEAIRMTISDPVCYLETEYWWIEKRKYFNWTAGVDSANMFYFFSEFIEESKDYGTE